MTDIFELPETFDPGAHEGTRDLEPMPIGWYQAQIVESEVRDASNGNGTYLLAVFEILDGEYQGRKIFQNVTLQNANQQAVEIGAAAADRHLYRRRPHRADARISASCCSSR